MISARNLTKHYSSIKAVDGVSFEISPGEVVGFLGPNGAGKTTTIRMLTTYLVPTEGEMRVLGLNPAREPRKVREIIGYLPENNPLYDDMETCRFLRWQAKTRSFAPGEIGKAVENTMRKCSLEKAAGRLIGQLSKGYKQRVGLAKALLHNPKILFLDEPTSGLDPNQALEVRELIKELKENSTVFLSTHILAEAKSICDRFIIIHEGKIAASGTLDEIVGEYSKERKIIVKFPRKPPADLISEISRIPGAVKTEPVGGGPEFRLEIFSRPQNDLRPSVYDFCVAKKLKPLEFYEEAVSFERIFAEITKKEDDDEQRW